MASPTISINNYTLGMAELRFYDKNAGKSWRIGNIVATSIAPETTFLDHFTVDNGTRKKDRSLITQKSIAINFTFDEITGTSIKHFLLATASGAGADVVNAIASASAAAGGGTGSSWFELLPMEAGEIIGSAMLTFNTAYGRDYTWYIPCASFKPDGSFDFNAEDWMNSKGIIEILQAVNSHSGRPYGWIRFDEAWSYENEFPQS